MELADRIAVLNRGRIAQLGSPQAIYDEPADLYVAKFIGAANEIFGRVAAVAADGTGSVSTDAGPVTGVLGEAGLAVGDEASVIVRPEKCRLVPADGTESANQWAVERVTALFMGASRRIVVRAPAWGDVHVQFSSGEQLPAADEALRLHVPPDCARIYRR